MRYVIIGNGMAGITAAQTLRRIDPDAGITIATDEQTPFYSRPGLMYHMMGLLKECDLRIARDRFYESLKADVLYDTATRIDTQKNVVGFFSGRILPFDRLLIAVGSKSRAIDIPGHDLPGIHYMYSLTDCRRIMAESRRGMKAVVIGGGLLGAELAEVWRHAGLDVVFLVLEPWYFPRGLSEPQGRIVEAEIRRRGCELYMTEEVVEFRGDARVSKVLTKLDRKFEADIVGVTIGVVPNTDLAKASDLQVGRGVVVDQTLQTSRSDVFAAGDCAEISPGVEDGTFIEQFWYSADRQGRLAAANMCGAARTYDPGVFCNTAKFFGVDYVSVGAGRQPDDGQDEETIVARHGRSARRFVCRGALVTGITSIGHDDNPRLIIDIVRDDTSLREAKTRLGGTRWLW
jgi:NAD(P)H-nitrite reductase large subunit